jgi:hypothetical protein
MDGSRLNQVQPFTFPIRFCEARVAPLRCRVDPRTADHFQSGSRNAWKSCNNYGLLYRILQSIGTFVGWRSRHQPIITVMVLNRLRLAVTCVVSKILKMVRPRTTRPKRRPVDRESLQARIR